MSHRKDPRLCRFKGCTAKPSRNKTMCKDHWPLFARIRLELEAERDRAYVIRRSRRKKKLIPPDA